MRDALRAWRCDCLAVWARLLVLVVSAVCVGCTDKAAPPDAEGSASQQEPASTLDLWAGVPPLEPQGEDIQARLQPRPGPLRPESVGEVIEAPFPADADPPAGSSPDPSETDGSSSLETALKVERFGPTGALAGQGALVDAIFVAFDRPMVPLGSIDRLAAEDPPLRIDPPLPGEARWLGTRTLSWVADGGRIPFSTTYEVTVPAGSRSTDGAELTEPVTWSFTTPPLALQWSSIGAGASNVELEPSIELRFNQSVQKTALLAALKLRGRGRTIALREAPAAASPASPAKSEPDLHADRTVRVQPETSLQPDTAYTLQLPPGVYGEGPNPSKAISLDFRTYPPLRLSGPSCRGPCPPEGGITLSSTTSITDASLHEKVHVEPEVEHLNVTSTYKGIHLSGDFEALSTYRISVDAGVTDRFGQTLAKPFTTRVKLGPLSPNLRLLTPAMSPGVIEADVGATLAVRVAGLEQLRVQGVGFEAEQIDDFLRNEWTWGEDWSWPSGLPAASIDDTLDVSSSRRQAQTLQLDLISMLTGGQRFGRVQVVSNAYQRWGRSDRSAFTQLVEVTDLGITAALDADGGAVLVTRLSDGMPVPAARVELRDTRDTALAEAVTDAMGVAHVSYSTSRTPRVVLASSADDQAFIRVDRTDARGQWMSWNASSDTPRSFFFTDRTPYKPGDTIHLVGILRLETRGPQGGVQAYRTAGVADWTMTDARGIEVATGEVEITPFGTFVVDVETTEEHGTGDYRFTLRVPNLFGSDQSFTHYVPVETYRPSEFSVQIGRESSVPLVFGDELQAQIEARYLHGGAMQGAEVAWSLSRTDSGFRPPGEHNEGFTFGKDRSWGYPGRWGRGHLSGYGSTPSRQVQSGQGQTDAEGTLVVRHSVLATDPPADPDSPSEDTDEPAASAEAELPVAATYTLSATVTDQNRQAIAGTSSFVVHPSQVYVGLRSDRVVLRQGERAGIDAIVVDLEGERVAGRSLDIELVRRVTERKTQDKDGRSFYTYETKEEQVDRCTATTLGIPATCAFTPQEAGTYVVRGTAKDDASRPTRTELTLYVHGNDAMIWDRTDRRVDLVPDRSKYEPGQEAAILVRSPFDDAMGFVVVEREGLSRQIPITISKGATAVRVPITEAMMPKVTVSAILTRGRVQIEGASGAQDLGMPAVATGQVEIDVSTKSRQIQIELEPSAREIEPKGTLSLDIRTRDGEGEARPAALAVMVVDEGVLSLMNHPTPDPLSFFHHPRSGGVWLGALHQFVLPRQGGEETNTIDLGQLGDVGRLGLGGGTGTGVGYGRGSGRAEDKRVRRRPARRSKGFAPPAAAPAADPAPAGARMAEEASAQRSEGGLDPATAMAQSVSLRTLFATTAFFDADVRTDEEGRAHLDIDMPENLTTFRVMVVAVDPEAMDRFGSADTTVRVRKPIMLRPSMPRFATFGDAFEAAVMVDNQTGSDQEVLVGMRGLNVELEGADQKLVKIPAGQAKEVRFDASTLAVGTMRVQFAAMSNAGRDATELSLPVHAPAVAEAFADYGMTGDSVQRTIEPPADALAGFGGLELSFSSTALSGLEDAVQYLVDYRYECAEQTASRILPIFVLGDVLDDFPIAGVRDRWRRKNLGDDGIARLLEKQSYDGGFGYWKKDQSWPYLTNWVTFALLEGKRAGFEVDEAALSRALRYVENFVEHGHRTRWGLYYDWTSRAFGLWLLSREGKGQRLFDRIWAHRDELPLYARVMLMSAAHRYGRTTEATEVLEQLRAAVTETARTIHFAESRTEASAQGLRVLMHSNVQTDAIALMGLLEVAPDDPMLPKLMAGIMAERDPRRGGRWGTTHANAWALLAASRYYETVESDEPDFVARIWLDQQFGGELQFKGRSMAKVQQTVPMADLLGEDERALTVAKEGPGKLYYRLGLRYAPSDFQVPARARGFEIYRTYEALDPDEADAVKRLDDGTWQVEAGTTVKVTIHLVARDRANYVVIDDALPAGFEGQNPRFVTSVGASSEATRDPGGSGRWWYPWWRFDHVDMRDDRVLLFADAMPAGVYTYAYTARATTIGAFKLPPIRAEAMYEPERFGHSASSEVRVVQ